MASAKETFQILLFLDRASPQLSLPAWSWSRWNSGSEAWDYFLVSCSLGNQVLKDEFTFQVVCYLWLPARVCLLYCQCVPQSHCLSDSHNWIWHLCELCLCSLGNATLRVVPLPFWFLRLSFECSFCFQCLHCRAERLRLFRFLFFSSWPLCLFVLFSKFQNFLSLKLIIFICLFVLTLINGSESSKFLVHFTWKLENDTQNSKIFWGYLQW